MSKKVRATTMGRSDKYFFNKQLPIQADNICHQEKQGNVVPPTKAQTLY
jgi:hypothetical protein